MAALTARRGRGEFKSDIVSFIRNHAPNLPAGQRWDEPSDAYDAIAEGLSVDKKRLYNHAKVIAEALLETNRATTRSRGNGAVSHVAEESPAEAALTMAQRIILRQEAYIKVCEVIIHERVPGSKELLDRLRETLGYVTE